MSNLKCFTFMRPYWHDTGAVSNGSSGNKFRWVLVENGDILEHVKDEYTTLGSNEYTTAALNRDFYNESIIFNEIGPFNVCKFAFNISSKYACKINIYYKFVGDDNQEDRKCVQFNSSGGKGITIDNNVTYAGYDSATISENTVGWCYGEISGNNSIISDLSVEIEYTSEQSSKGDLNWGLNIACI